MKNIFFSLLVSLFLFPPMGMAEKYDFVTFEFPPLEYAGENGDAKGIAVEIVTKIMTKLDHTINIEILPWARALNMMREGKADAIFTAYKNDEREKFLIYSNFILVPQVVCFYKKQGSSITYDGDLSKLSDIQIGIISNISYGIKFDEFRDKLQLQRVAKMEQNFKKLQLGRIDLVISNLYVAEAELDKIGLQDEFVRLPQEVQKVPSYIAFSKKRNLKKLRDQFDLELEKFKSSGEYAKMMHKYGIYD